VIVHWRVVADSWCNYQELHYTGIDRPARLFVEMDWRCGRPRVGRACALQAARRRRRPDVMISAGPGPPLPLRFSPRSSCTLI